MFSNEFESYFDQPLKPYFDGVCSFDNIPSFLKVDHFIICNTADSASKGEHWFALYKSSLGVLECFDSLGVNEIKRKKLLHLKIRGVRQIKFNTTAVQSQDSTKCGHFCVFFIYQRLFNKDLCFCELMNSIYTLNTKLNEENVLKFLEEIK